MTTHDQHVTAWRMELEEIREYFDIHVNFSRPDTLKELSENIDDKKRVPSIRGSPATSDSFSDCSDQDEDVRSIEIKDKTDEKLDNTVPPVQTLVISSSTDESLKSRSTNNNLEEIHFDNIVSTKSDKRQLTKRRIRKSLKS